MTIDRKTIEAVATMAATTYSMATSVIEAYRTDQRRREVVEVPVELLKKTEWQGHKGEDRVVYYACPCCKAILSYGDHTADCEYAAILREWEELK